jgi:uracil-DNA glycosylase family 4
MDAEKLSYLNAMGIQAWQLKEPLPSAAPLCHSVATAPTIAVPTTDWESLRAAVASCTACGLDKTRTQTVFGVGNQQAELMVIGEAPGLNEDKQGEPFVGRAGQLLTAMLEAIGFPRETVYIANILKCRPPNNRDPQVEEVSLCTPFLQKQIALVQPKLLLAVGRIAAHYLLNTKTALSQLRGKIHTYGSLNTPLIVTYHPAYLLRSPKDKGKAYEDLQLAYRNLKK